MIASILIITLISSGLLASIIWPVHLPAGMITAIDQLAAYLWAWDGLVDVATLLSCLWFLFFVSLMILVFKLVIGLIALVSGAGKPDL